MKERPINFSDTMVRAILEGRKTQTRRAVKNIKPNDYIDIGPHTEIHVADLWSIGRSPYGQPGDRLWVREAWAGTRDGRVIYRADPSLDGADIAWPWRPSIHMSRGLSRLTLEITAIRVERIQDITVEDARAEGMQGARTLGDFSELWDSINAARGYGWEANPWVWVIEFNQMRRNNDPKRG